MATMSDKVAEISDPTHHTSLMNSLRSFINTESFIDVQFICQGGHKVYAHKLMLISVSGLLKKVLIENPDSNEMITIHLPDISSKLLRIVITFLYIGYMRLSSAEMDQFKMVLGLLDIEIFQKIRDQENSTNPSCSDPLSATSNNSSSNNNIASTNKTESFFESVPSVVDAGSLPVGRRIGTTQGVVPAEYGPIAQSSAVTHVASVPVDSGPQYITIRTDQLGIPNNCGEVMLSYSAVPVHHASSGMVVQHSAQRVTAGQGMLQGQTQYNTMTSNVINSPLSATHVTANNSGISSNVSINNIGQVSSSQVNVQHVSTLPVQPGGQQILRLVPVSQAQQPIVNSNTPFSTSQPEMTSPVSVSHLNVKAEFNLQRHPLSVKSSLPVAQNAHDMRGNVTTPQYSNVSNNSIHFSNNSSQPQNVDTHGSKKKFKGVKRKSSSNVNRPTVQTSSISQDIIIDLSDDEPGDPRKPVNMTTNRHRVKSRKTVHNSGIVGSVSSSSSSSSSLNIQSVPRNSSLPSSSRMKHKSDSKDIIEVNLTDSKSSVKNIPFNKY